MNIYCVYLTSYRGNKLPPFYIGYSTSARIETGSGGSVLSKKYKTIWDSERKNNIHLFNTKIVSIHNTREEALLKEYALQKALDVVKSPMYINMAYASPSGYFGRDVTGKLNPMYNRTHTPETRKSLSEAARGSNNAHFGKVFSTKTRLKMSMNRRGKGLSITADHHRRNSMAQIGVQSEEKHPLYNNNTYQFTHKTYGCFIGTRKEFQNQYAGLNLNRSCLLRVMRGERTVHRGWAITMC